MLNEVIKQTQNTISTILDDINYITGKLNGTIEQVTALTDNVVAIKDLNSKLKQQIAMLKGVSGAADILNDKAHNAEGASNKLKCAAVLDLSKLEALTSEPTKQKFYDYIRSFYIEKESVEEKNNDSQIIKKWTIDPSKKAEFSQLAKAFEAIGYFNVSDVLAGKTKQVLSGLFS
jgi:small-conductance mechanosensitive channel